MMLLTGSWSCPQILRFFHYSSPAQLYPETLRAPKIYQNSFLWPGSARKPSLFRSLNKWVRAGHQHEMCCLQNRQWPSKHHSSSLKWAGVGGTGARSSKLFFTVDGDVLWAFDLQKTWPRWQATIFLFLCLSCTSKIHNILFFKFC